MRRNWVACTVGCFLCAAAWGQGVIGDVLSGSLVKPKTGEWAWYNLTDSATGNRFVVRQAIVGSEQVGQKTGYWLETEVIPTIGYKSVFKMLVTGPARDPRNVHKIVRKQGLETVEKIDVKGQGNTASPEEQARESLGKETIKTACGDIEAEHVVVTSDGARSDVWLNDSIYPMGIVRLVSPQGELLLRNYGEGGDYANSALDENAPQGVSGLSEAKIKIDVEAKGKAKVNYKGRDKKQGKTSPKEKPKSEPELQPQPEPESEPSKGETP